MPTVPKDALRVFHYALLRLSIKHPIRSILVVLAIYGALGIAFYGAYKIHALQQEQQLLKSAPYREQIERLMQLENSLRAFQGYLIEQKRSLQITEESMQALKAEHDALQPIVAADRATVAAVLEAQKRKSRASRWFDLILSFVFGVISSLVATFIWWIVTRPKNDLPKSA